MAPRSGIFDGGNPASGRWTQHRVWPPQESEEQGGLLELNVADVPRSDIGQLLAPHGVLALSSLPIASARSSVCNRSYLTSSSPCAIDGDARINRARTAWLQYCVAVLATSSRVVSVVCCVLIDLATSRCRHSSRSWNSPKSIKPWWDVCAAASAPANSTAASAHMLFRICEISCRGYRRLNLYSQQGRTDIAQFIQLYFVQSMREGPAI